MNRFKKGDKVTITKKQHQWHLDHLIELFEIHQRFKSEDYPELIMWLKTKPGTLKGKVTGYGSTDEDYKDKRDFIRVNFNKKTYAFFSEKDLRKV